MSNRKKVLILECAGLDMNAVSRSTSLAGGCGLTFSELVPVFPAVTCTAQASMRTGLAPSAHGIIANGRYDRRSRKVEFWNQSAGLYAGERIWERARASGKTVGVMFTQQSLGDDTDYCLSPAPVHKHHGGMIQACQTRPAELEGELTRAVGRPFKLHTYWGPMATSQASLWCAESTAALMKLHGPDILFSYLPHLDYCLQREGPDGPSLPREADVMADCLRLLMRTASDCGYEMVVWGDYSITRAEQVVYPNRVLLEAGLFVCREVGGMLYPNLFDSRAFAMSDHQVAHIYVHAKEDVSAAQKVLASLPGVESVQTPAQAGLDNPECGELVLTASPGAWFSYQWWRDKRNAPDYATHMDIHNKIGFDPCELFWNFPYISTCTDCSRIKGTHGRQDAPAAFAVTDGLGTLRASASLTALSASLKELL